MTLRDTIAETPVTPQLLSPRIRALPATIPFVGPEALERRLGRPFRARLGANESVFGPSPRAVAAMGEAAALSWAYGDPEQFDLRGAMSARLGVSRGEVMLGEGIDGLFGVLMHLACDPGDTVLTSFGAYPTFAYHAAANGVRVETVPYHGEARVDLDALAARARALKPKLVYLANPDNPTGSFAARAAVEEFVAAIPAETIIVLDEAYADFAPPEALIPNAALRPNLLRFRTFSKAYGLAGARVGAVFGEAGLIGEFDKLRNHFGLSRVSQAGALAALGDEAHLAAAINFVARGRAALARIAARFGFDARPSSTNFVAIDLKRDGAYARAVLEAVLQRGVFIRMPAVAPLDRMLRVTVGTQADLALFEEALVAALDDVAGRGTTA